MSFFGGGTDIEHFFKNYRGAVISTTFDKYVYVTVRHLPRFFDYKTELFYSKLEKVNAIDEIEHPMIKNAMRMLDMRELHVAYDADLPARTGLGTSSSFAVGLLNAFYCLKGKHRSKKDLASDAIYLERVLCKEKGGWQDQIAASFGGLNRIDFDASGFKIRPIIISPKRKKELNSRLMLFFTGFTRFSADIQESATASLDKKTDVLEQMLRLVDEAQDVLENKNKDLDDFGFLLNQSWNLKKQMSDSISKKTIDILYDKALSAGALGGKLLGAGGGGFLLFYVRPESRESVRQALDLMEVPFEFEDTGTSVIYYSPELFDVDK